MTLNRIVFVAALVVVGCGKKSDSDEKKADKGEKSEKGEKAEAPPAKSTKEDCTKLANHQIEIEKDASMKSAMKASFDGLVSTCLDSTTTAQVACMMKATDGPGFADCAMRR
jgi:hypothetical protein